MFSNWWQPNGKEQSSFFQGTGNILTEQPEKCILKFEIKI